MLEDVISTAPHIISGELEIENLSVLEVSAGLEFGKFRD